MQTLFTCATRIVSGAPTFMKGVPLESIERLSAGVYQLTFSPELNANEQVPDFTPSGTDPTADYQIEIVGGGPLFSQLNIRTNIGGNPADVDGWFLMEQVRVADAEPRR